jgi:hypothetical protein
MAVARVGMIKLGVTNGDLITLVSVVLGVTLPLVAARLVEGTRLGFLFTRPQFLRLGARKMTDTAKRAAVTA